MIKNKNSEKKNFIYTILALCFIIIISSILMEFYGVEYLKELVQKYDIYGFFALITIMNVVIQPISPDFIIAGSPFFLRHETFTVAWISALAAITSGLLAYSLGSLIGMIGFKRFFGEKNTGKGVILYKKYGVWAIILSAVTPIPYSLVCWMAGIFKMNPLLFTVAITLTRAPRHILVTYYGPEITNFMQQII